MQTWYCWIDQIQQVVWWHSQLELLLCARQAHLLILNCQQLSHLSTPLQYIPNLYINLTTFYHSYSSVCFQRDMQALQACNTNVTRRRLFIRVFSAVLGRELVTVGVITLTMNNLIMKYNYNNYYCPRELTEI